MGDTSGQSNRTLGSSNIVAEGECKSFVVNGADIIILRKNGELRAFANRCPHLGIPLNWLPDKFLDDDEELIQCATHGALFLPDTGECISGPCVGEALSAITVAEVNGNICISEGFNISS